MEEGIPMFDCESPAAGQEEKNKDKRRMITQLFL